MKESYHLLASALLLALTGCVSAERIADYEAWKVSDDAVENVEFNAFEAQYKEGWQERAAEKKAARLAKKEAERKERERIEAERRATEKSLYEAQKAEIARNTQEKIDAAQRKRESDMCAESERLELELAAAEKPIFEEYRRRINVYWGNKARETYQSALTGQYKELSRFIEIAENGTSSLIESFAEEKMPNANGVYEKAKERAMELQQVYNEEFSAPEKPGSDKYAVYCVLLEQLAKARMAYIRAYQELAHYYFNYKFGVVTQDELAKIDETPITIPFFDIEPKELPVCKDLGVKESEFGLKYMPDSYVIYQQYRKDFVELISLIREASNERFSANVTRGPVFQAAFNKATDLCNHINRMTSEYIELYMKHRLGEKNFEDLAQIDSRRVLEEKEFMDELSVRVKMETEIADTCFFNKIRNEMRDAIKRQSDKRKSEIESIFSDSVLEIESEANKVLGNIVTDEKIYEAVPQEFDPSDEVYETVDEKIIEVEKAAIRRLLNDEDKIKELKPFVSISATKNIFQGYTYFSVSLKPKVDPTFHKDELPVVPKDVVVLLDASGSIGNERLESCRSAVKRILRTMLNTGDRFNLVAIRDKYKYFDSAWSECNQRTFDKADDWLNNLAAHGRGDVFRTISSVMTLPRDPTRPLIAMIVTDGEANTGVSETAEILTKFTELNDGMISVYMYGVESSANKELINVLTRGNRGDSYIHDGSRWTAGKNIDAFSNRFRDPTLTDIQLVLTSTNGDLSVFPRRLKNLYRGETLTFCGRVKGAPQQVAFGVKGLNGDKSYESYVKVPLSSAPFDPNVVDQWRSEYKIDNAL